MCHLRTALTAKMHSDYGIDKQMRDDSLLLTIQITFRKIDNNKQRHEILLLLLVQYRAHSGALSYLDRLKILCLLLQQEYSSIIFLCKDVYLPYYQQQLQFYSTHLSVTQ